VLLRLVRDRTGDSYADISDSEVVVAILAHLGLPTEAPPMARARSPAFELARVGNGSGTGRRRDDVARAKVCREDDVREVRGSLG
jgi:hypothetical protein